MEKTVGKAVREAIAEGHVKREELFITTKIWPHKYSYVADAARDSLRLLGLDYVDLLLLHWPINIIKEGEKLPKGLPMHKVWP